MAKVANCLAALLLALLLSGCSAAAWAVAGGIITVAKDVIGLDTALMQNTPGKTPLKQILPMGESP
jgi:hypothetical protein